MKNTLHVLLILLFSFAVHKNSVAAANNTPLKNGFELRLKINGFSNETIKLFGILGDQNYGIDSARVDENGNAVFNQDTALPGGMYFVVFPDLSLVQFLLDEEQQFSMEFTKSDAVNSMKVTGSLDNELLYKNLQFELLNGKRMDAVKLQLKDAAKGSELYTSLETELQKLKDERKMHIKSFSESYPKSFFTKFKTAGQNPELKKRSDNGTPLDDNQQVYYYRNDFWKGYDFSDERLLRTSVYFNKLKRYMLDITPQDYDTIIKYADWVITKSKASKEVFKFTANWIAVHYKEAKILGRDNIYVFLVEKFWTPEQAFWSKDYEIQRLRMQAQQMKVSLIGATAHDIKGVNENGQQVSLYESKAPITIAYMFSYDCENCIKETPKLMKVYNEWKAKGLDVFTVCVDGEPEGWKEYLKKNGMVDRNIFDPENKSNFRAHYYYDVTPGIFVLDKNHKIIATNVAAESLHVLLEKELGN